MEETYCEEKEYFVHKSSYIDDNVIIGKGTKIWHFSHVLSGCKIGKNCVIGQNVVIGPEVIIGDGCKIQNNVSVYKGITIGDYVFLGPSCVLTNVVNPRAFINRKNEFRNTIIQNGATVGANSTILCNITLGEYCFVAAGSVVTKDVKPYSLVIGNPAKHIRFLTKDATL